MALKLILPSDPIHVKRLNMLIFGQAGVCKSSLAFTCEAPMCFAFDPGVYRAHDRNGPVVMPDRWDDVATLTASDFSGVKTVIIDTVGKALDMLTMDIIAKDPKAGRAGQLSLQGYGTLRNRFSAWMKQLNSYGFDTLLIAHMTEATKGDEILERISVVGSTKDLLLVDADAVGRVSMVNDQRTLCFSPTSVSTGKDPAGIGSIPLPSHLSPEWKGFMGRIYQATKDKINAMTDAQMAASQLQSEWLDRIAQCSEAPAFNDALAEVRALPKALQSAFNRRAAEVGLVFDKATGAYVAAEVV